MSKLEDSIKPHINQILNGTLLCIDPSSGSKNSMPGYAIYKEGKLMDSGFIEIEYRTDLNRRLYHLRKTLTEEFDAPDILVTENVPPIMMGKGFFNRSMLSLQKAIGVVISCFDCPLVEVAPISWRSNIPEDYNKTDENDAILMGYTTLKIASKLSGKPIPELKDLPGKLTTRISNDETP